MRLRATLAGVAASIAVVAGPASAITYGTPDGGSHPNVGALVGDFGGDLFQVCSGTLVSPAVFLTASHCTSYLEEQGASALVTFDPVLGPSSTLIAGTMHTNPAYFSSGVANTADVAVVVLDTPVLGIAPAALPTAGLLDRLGARAASGTRRSRPSATARPSA